jgi:integrase
MRGVAGPEDDLNEPFDAAKALDLLAGEDLDGDDGGAHDVSLTEAQLDALAVLPGVVGALVARDVPTKLLERDAKYKRRALAESTRLAYAQDWGRWTGWCAAYGFLPMPAGERELRLFLLELSDEGIALGTLERVFAAIRAVHAQLDRPLPTMPSVRNVIRNLRRERDSKPIAKAPLLASALLRVREVLPKTAIGVRNAAILLLGFSAALRRSEIVALEVRDLRFTAPEGVVVTLRKSKTDQEGEGREIGVPYSDNPDVCPVRALQAWLEGAEIDHGRVFRKLFSVGPGRYMVGEGGISAGLIATVVKDFAERVGLDPKEFAGHSLRAGMVTQASLDGIPIDKIMAVTGHTSPQMVMRYVRHADPFSGMGNKGLLDDKGKA